MLNKKYAESDILNWIYRKCYYFVLQDICIDGIKLFSFILQIFAIIRDQENPQKFRVEYVKGAIRTYLSTDR